MEFTINHLLLTLRLRLSVHRKQTIENVGKTVNGKLRTIAAAAIMLVPLYAVGHLAAAAGPQGVTVSPAFQQVSVLPGETSHQVTFKITNNESSVQSFDLSATDFNTLGESGGLFFVGTNPTALQKKYGLAKWFSLPQDSLTLGPGQSATINAQILNLPDLAPGGHYGALMLASASQPGAAPNSVALHPIASSLMFVTKVGGDTHRLQLSSVKSDANFLKLPSNVTLRFYNDGNTHVIPRGVIKLSTAGGKLVSRGVINQDSNIILPGMYRQIQAPLVKSAGGPAIGRYQLSVDFRFDGYDTYREYKTTFWHIEPSFIVGLALLAVSVVILAGRRRQIKK